MLKYAAELQIFDQIKEQIPAPKKNAPKQRRTWKHKCRLQARSLIEKVSNIVSGYAASTTIVGEPNAEVTASSAGPLNGMSVYGENLYLELDNIVNCTNPEVLKKDRHNPHWKVIKLNKIILKQWYEGLSSEEQGELREALIAILQHNIRADLYFDIDEHFYRMSLGQLVERFNTTENQWHRGTTIQAARDDWGPNNYYKYTRNLEPVVFTDGLKNYQVAKAENGWINVDGLEHVLVLTLPPIPGSQVEGEDKNNSGNQENDDSDAPGVFATAVAEYEAAGRVFPFSACC
jgi:hypothetical protein